MDYILTFEDGSDGYLSHHGVLGMKWGVRNAETRARYAKAKQYQKALNRQDRQLQNDAMEYYNFSRAKNHYETKARIAGRDGKTQKQAKALAKAEIAKGRAEAYRTDYVNTSMEYLKTAKQMANDGYEFKVTQTQFNQWFPDARKQGRSYAKKYGRRPYNSYYANAASGNQWTVRDPSQISDKKKSRWAEQKHIQAHRPQTVYYHYY